MNNYTIRAHHGMCLAFFKGEGYSSEFTGHMQHMKELLNGDAVVKIVAAADDICLYCPNNLDGICEEDIKVEKYDNQVLELCNLERDTEIKWKEFENLVWNRILTPGMRKNICGNCEWNGLCGEVSAEQQFGRKKSSNNKLTKLAEVL